MVSSVDDHFASDQFTVACYVLLVYGARLLREVEFIDHVPVSKISDLKGEPATKPIQD